MSDRERAAAEEVAPALLRRAHPPHRRDRARPRGRRRTCAYLKPLKREASLRGRGEPLMAAPSTGRRRPAGRRGGGLSREPRGRARQRRRRPHPAPPLRLHRLPRARRRQGRGAGVVVAAPHPDRPGPADRRGRAAGAPRLDPGQERRRAGGRQAAADRVRGPAPAGGPEGGGGRALRRAADQPPQGAPGRRGALVPGKKQKKWFAYVARKVDPRARQGGPGPRPARRGQLHRGGADVSAQGHGGAGPRLRRHGEQGPGRHGAALRQGALGQGRQRDHRARPRRPRPEDGARSQEPVVRRRTCVSRSTARSSTTRRTCSRRRCATPAASRPSRIVMDPRTGEVLAMANVTREGFHGFGKGTRPRRRTAPSPTSYEPGSIFKLVTISGALADGTVTPDTKFTLAAEHPRGRPRDPRRRSRAARSTYYGARRSSSTPATSARSRSASEDGRGGPAQVDQGLRLRQADRHRSSPVRRAASSPRSTSGPARRSATSPWDRASP